MSRSTKTFSLGLGVLIFSIVSVFFMDTRRGGGSEGSVQPRITLVAKEMAFRTEESLRESSAGRVNPPLVFRPGQTVQIVIRNEDPGIVHSFAMEGREDRPARHLRYGETEVITLTVPETGTIEYFCLHHPQMMRGKIIIASGRLATDAPK